MVYSKVNMADQHANDVIIPQSHVSHSDEVKGIKALLYAQQGNVLAFLAKDTVAAFLFMDAEKNKTLVVFRSCR